MADKGMKIYIKKKKLTVLKPFKFGAPFVKRVRVG